MKQAIIALALVGAVSGSVPASAQVIMGHGVNSCGKWIERRKSDTIQSYIGELAWVIGYLYRGAEASGRDFLKDPDAEALAAYVDNYCAANPLDVVADAAMALETELSKRTPRSKAPLAPK